MIIKRGDERVYIRKVWGGFCWPGDARRGHCCIVGEALAPILDMARGYVFQLYYLEEFCSEGDDSRELLDAAVGMTERFNVERWYGRGYHDIQNTAFLKAWNRGIKTRSAKRFTITPALNSDTESITYQLQVIDSCLRPGEVTLNWTRGTRIEEETAEVSGVNWSDATCKQFPAIAACGYVVSMMKALAQREVPMFG